MWMEGNYKTISLWGRDYICTATRISPVPCMGPKPLKVPITISWMNKWLDKSLSCAEDQQNNFIQGGKGSLLPLQDNYFPCVSAARTTTKKEIQHSDIWKGNEGAIGRYKNVLDVWQGTLWGQRGKWQWHSKNMCTYSCTAPNRLCCHKGGTWGLGSRGRVVGPRANSYS